MTRDELARTLSAIEQAHANRVEIWCVILDPTGKEVGRIYRGSFQRPRGSQVGESQGDHHEKKSANP
jgi:hypothetical protein